MVVRWSMWVCENVKSIFNTTYKEWLGQLSLPPHSKKDGAFLHVLISLLGFSLGPPAASHSPKSYICAIVELAAVNWPEMCVFVSICQFSNELASPTSHWRHRSSVCLSKDDSMLRFSLLFPPVLKCDLFLPPQPGITGFVTPGKTEAEGNFAAGLWHLSLLMQVCCK